MRFLFGVLAISLLTAIAAQAQVPEKAEITVRNMRPEAVTMRFSYAFRSYTWKLMEYAIPIDGDVTYRYPAGLPGCQMMRDWGITDGVLTLSSAQGVICERRMSLCDKVVLATDVGIRQCTWRELKIGQ